MKAVSSTGNLKLEVGEISDNYISLALMIVRTIIVFLLGNKKRLQFI